MNLKQKKRVAYEYAQRITKLQETLGYSFERMELLHAALTHRSYRFEHQGKVDNQRLEFLGDAVLGFFLADRVFHGYAKHPEGMLTVLRASVASGIALAAKARSIGLGDVLMLGVGESQTGGAERESNLADAFEAVLGAVYVDGGIAGVTQVFNKLFAAEVASLKEDPWTDNPKGHLQSVIQKKYHLDPTYETLEEIGPKHCSRYRVRVTVGTMYEAEGEGNTKRIAQAAAATTLLNGLNTMGLE